VPGGITGWGRIRVVIQQVEIEEAVHEALKTMHELDREEVAMFLIDPLVLYILGATSKRCLTVAEMVPVVNLPIATCYKLVYQMEGHGLLASCGTQRTGRGRAAAYTSVLKEMSLDMRNCVMHISVTWKNGVTEEFRREMGAQVPREASSSTSLSYPVSEMDVDQALGSD
jgi:hypothetical protein